MSIDYLTASKRLGRMKISVINDSFKSSTLWCRTAFDENEQWDMSNHRHSTYEIHYVLDGHCEFLLSNEYFVSLYANDFIIVKPQQMHKLISTSNNLAKFVSSFTLEVNRDNFDGEFICDAYNACGPHSLYHGSSHISDLIVEMMHSAYMRLPGCTLTISALFNLILVECAKSILPDYQNPNSLYELYKSNTHAELTQHFIADNIRNGIVSGDVAKHLNMSLRQLNRILQHNLNTTVAQMIEDEKIKLLRNLLLSDSTLEEIAELAGFSNEFNMSRFFKRLEGMSPGKYRQAFYK